MSSRFTQEVAQRAIRPDGGVEDEIQPLEELVSGGLRRNGLLDIVDRLGGLAGKKAIEECRGDMAFLKIGIVEYPSVERNRSLDTFDNEFIQRATHSGHRFLAITSVGNQFGDQ